MSAGDFERATRDLAGRCLAKFDDSAASAEIRAFALDVMVSQVSNGNTAMLAYVPEVCQRLKDYAAPNQPGAQDYHRQIIKAVFVVFKSPQETLARVRFDPVVQYLVQLVACEDIEIASLACEFWSRYAGIPLSFASVREPWMAAFKPELPKLLAALVDRMIFREHAELSSFKNLCKLTAAALEDVVLFYPSELVCAAFRPLLERRIKSDLWWEKEAAIRALRAFTEAAGQ